MKIVFLSLVLFHALIHVMGFVKGFRFAELKGLTLPVSKPIGVLWLLSAVLFLIFSVLYATKGNYTWLLGLIAVFMSQVLISFFWKDAKFGTLPNIIIFIVSLMGLGAFQLREEFKSRVNSDFSETTILPTGILTEKDIAHLPVAVKNYLRYTKSVGQPKLKNFKAEFSGLMYSTPDDKGIPIKTIQYNFFKNPSRYFYISGTKMGLPVTALHIYQNETATFQVKLLNWFKVVDAKGKEMDRGETVTLFNDMCLIAPATLIDKRIAWESVNDTLVKASFTNGGITIKAALYFNKKHELVNFMSYDRYETDGEKYHNYPWSTPVEHYKMLNGYMLPGRGKVIFHKPNGDFVYGQFVYKSVNYNVTAVEQF
ncbi:DUF6544 family protein [Formosa sp. S-31]|uniref:DUF6544 family protein n=1 Tax=Formosa sp. S-31 TaxID=2790949 RepID=UPI003EBAA929